MSQDQLDEGFMTAKIAPSILSADASRFGEEIQAVSRAGADLIHIDVMDGCFVPNITLGPAIVSGLRKTTDLPFDVHLMIERPESFLEDFAKAGSDLLTVHVEAGHHLHRVVGRIRDLGKKAGVSLNPATPLVQIEPILPELDLLLVMTVNPGFGGQRFIPAMLSKIAAARRMIDELSPGCLLSVDGGITLENIRTVKLAGADIIVAGQAIYGAADYRETIGKMKTALS